MSSFWKRLFPDYERRTLVMGVLNVTPDSFSDGGEYIESELAIERGLELHAQCADIVDIGGESTRPGAELVSAEEELNRITPVIKGLVGKVPISVDTNKSQVAKAVLEMGVEVINDISGGQFDPRIRQTVAESQSGYIIMQTRDIPKEMQKGEWNYEGGVVHAVREILARSAALAVDAGIPRERLMIDPGFGFGKTVEENCQLLANLQDFQSLGLPILIGTSRKSFLGHLTGKPVDARLSASLASIALAASQQASMVRVHDVDATKDVLCVVDACVRPQIHD